MCVQEAEAGGEVKLRKRHNFGICTPLCPFETFPSQAFEGFESPSGLSLHQATLYQCVIIGEKYFLAPT